MSVLRSTLGWTQISRSDVGKATDILQGGEQGVRDEIGFLALHQGFANRFFPGTSVLQTRLRYALFVPWQIEEVAARSPGSTEAAADYLASAEQHLVRRLLQAEPGSGIIGSRSYNQQPAQPPSVVYWSALRAWRILQPLRSERPPGRDAVLNAMVARKRDDNPDEAGELRFFYDLPSPPREWGRHDRAARGLTFALEKPERDYLLRRLTEVKRLTDRGEGQELSLFARLAVGRRIGGTGWPDEFDDQSVLALARDGDAEALALARQASSLARIGRAVYSALVEDIAKTEDKASIGSTYRENLEEIVAMERSSARACGVAAIVQAVGPLDGRFRAALVATLEWLRHPQGSVRDLLEPYRASEVWRKRGRARLAPGAASLRAAWLHNQPRFAEGLNYRWHRVRQLLNDLHGC